MNTNSETNLRISFISPSYVASQNGFPLAGVSFQ